jgi:hypothetical protein
VSSALEVNSVVDWLLRSGVKLRSVTPQGTGLEEIFLSAAEGDPPRAEGETPRGEDGPPRVGADARRPGHAVLRPGSATAGPEPAAQRLERGRRVA